MICPSCNREIDNDSIYCTYCGVCIETLLDRNSNSPHFRNIRDINNIVPYSTLHLKENHLFISYLYNNFQDCKIETMIAAKSLFPAAPAYAMPINFLITKENKQTAILLVEGGAKYQRYSVLETMELCKENNITALRFITTCPNQEAYVVQRIRKTLE